MPLILRVYDAIEAWIDNRPGLLPAALDHLAQVTDEKMPPGSLGNADAAYRVPRWSRRARRTACARSSSISP